MAEHVNTGNFFSDYFCLKTGATSDKLKFEACLRHYDDDKDGKLNRTEFHNLISDLFGRNETQIEATDLEKQIFDILDDDQDGVLNHQEFYLGWRHWLKQVLDPVTALIVVDVQNDFVDGSLSLKGCPAEHNGAEVIPVINRLIDTVPFDLVVYTKDWHPGNHISFIDNIKMRPLHDTCGILADRASVLDEVIFHFKDKCVPQRMWPIHCVQNTPGADLHSDLKIRHDAVVVHKGTDSDIDSYSAFWDNGKEGRTELCDIFKKRRVTDVYICGLAYDICVGYTAVHAIEHGFRTVLIEDACRGVCQSHIDHTRNNLREQGAVIAQSEEVRKMVMAEDRRLELGHKAGLNLQVAKALIRRESIGQRGGVTAG